MLVKIHQLTPRGQAVALLRAVADAVEYSSPVPIAAAAQARDTADTEALKVAIAKATPPGMVFVSLMETPKGIDATYHPAGKVHHQRHVHVVLDERDTLSVQHHSTVRAVPDWRLQEPEVLIRTVRQVVPRC